MRYRPWLIAAILILALAPGQARAADAIEVRGKTTRISGTIQNETPTAVTIQRVTGQTETIPADQIVDIQYDSQPIEAAQARLHELSGKKIKQAIAEYGQVAAAMSGRSPARTAVQFAQARAEARLALLDPSLLAKAVAMFRVVQPNAAEGHLRYPTDEWLARLYLAQKDYGRADGVADDLATAPWPATKIRAELIKARALAGRRQTDQARAAIDAILAESPEGAAARVEQQAAALFQAELVAPRDPAAALTTLRQVIARTPSAEGPEVQAQAYDLMGDILQAQGKTDQALLAYLHVDILYPRERTEDARAIYAIGQLWAKLNQPERARDAFATLRRQHPESPWAAKVSGAVAEEESAEDEADGDSEMTAPAETAAGKSEERAPAPRGARKSAE